MAEKKRIVIFDKEEDYALKLWEYIRCQKRVPWDTYLYTDWQTLKQQGDSIDMLVVAERSFEEEMCEFSETKLVVMNETGRIHLKSYDNIDKYQPADRIYRQLLGFYEAMAGDENLFLSCGEKSIFLGVYSPVKRCMQTSFALTLGQLLGKEHTCLYVTLEQYAGEGELLFDSKHRNLSDLLYFLDSRPDKFTLRLQIMVEKKGNLDIVPAARVGQDLLSISSKEWLRFFHELENTGLYEYIVLDLSDGIQGLFDVLRICRRIYTITREDPISKGKLLQYERLLASREYEDVLEKTRKCNLPVLKSLPVGIEQYTRGDLAIYVRREVDKLMRE